MKAYKGIEAVRPAGGTLLEVAFKGGWSAVVDLDPWIDAVPMLQPLRDPGLFARARVHEWGWHAEWVPDELDIAGDQLWRLAGEQAGELMPVQAFRDWRQRHGLSLASAAATLGLSRRLVAYYDSGERPIPKHVMLACEGWAARHAKQAA